MMASQCGEMEVVSEVDTEDMTECARHVKDSSNDEDSCKDSSGAESSQYTLGFDSDGMATSLQVKPSKSSKCSARTGSRQEVSSKEATATDPQLSGEPSSVYADQNSLVMTEEEKIFHEQNIEANQAQLCSLKCTTCSTQLFLVDPNNIKFHPVLGVIVCRGCREYYSADGSFTQDESGHDEFCRWCAEGGKMICCDNCSNVFCKACLRRCLGRAGLSEIQSPGFKWNCLACDNHPIWPQRSLSRTVLNAMQKNSRRSKRWARESGAAEMSNDPSIWLPSIINEAEKLATYCKALAHKVGTNWSKDKPIPNTSSGIAGEDNSEATREANRLKVINCCRKLRKAVVTTRFNMKILEKKLVTRYSLAYGNANEISVDYRSEASASLASSSNDSPRRRSKKSSDPRLILKFKNFRGGKAVNEKGGDDFYAEIRKSPKSSPTPVAKKSPISNSNGSIHSLPTVRETSSPLPVPEELVEDGQDVEPFFDTLLPDELPAAKNDVQSSQDCAVVDLISSDSPDPLELPALKMSPVSEPAEEPSTSSLGGLTEALDEETRSSPSKWKSSKIEKKQATPSSRKSFKLDRSIDSADDDATVPLSMTSQPSPKAAASVRSLDENEKARLKLLKDSSEDDDGTMSDSDILQRKKIPTKSFKNHSLLAPGLDDPKLQATCSVVVSRLSDLDAAVLADNRKQLSSKKTNLLSTIYVTEKPECKALSSGEGAEGDSESEETAVVRSRPKPIAKKGKVPKRPFRLEDLGSSSESDSPSPHPDASPSSSPTPFKTEEVEEEPTTAQVSVIDRNEAARLELLASSSSEDDLEGAEETEATSIEKEPLVTKIEESFRECTAETTKDEEGDQKDTAGDDGGGGDEDDDIVQPSKMKVLKLLRMSLADPEESKSGNVTEESGATDDKKKAKKTVKKKKGRIHSDSDFESSASESEKKKKQKNLKKKRSDSSAEDNSDEETAGSKPKRRRRIKKAASSSDQDSDDSDIKVLNESHRSEQGGSKGRKNIKKIMKDQNLKDETKAAAKEEEARKKRIAERQKYYNEAFTGDMALENAKIDRLVLDFDPKTKEELVAVNRELVTKLKPHQVKGVKFMWDACFESVERIKEHPGSGCILAHCMGLGKSLQVVTLVHTVLTHEACQVKRAMVVCPLSTVLNWVNEFKIWLPGDLELEVYELASLKSNDLRVYTLRNWMENGGVLIMGYDMYRNLSNENSKKIKAKAREVFQRSLVDPGPDLVVCDEGHMLKNESTALSKAMNRLRTKRRIVLTGTPLQNRLDEYHCMIQFVKPNLLGTKKEFTNRFANPIKNGQAADSTESDVRIMKRRAHVLHKMLEDSVQRFDYSVLTPFLPPKHEYVISVKMSDIQIKMYQHYLEHYAKGGPCNVGGGRGKGAGLFADFQELGRVWTHPKALLMAQITRDMKAIEQSDEDSLNDFIVDDRSTPMSDDGGVVLLEESEDDEPIEETKKNGWKSRTRSGRGDAPPPEEELGVTAPLSGSWWSQFVTDDDMTKIEHSGKLVLLMDILRQCELIGDKILVFSQSLVSLNLIEEFLAAEDARNEQNRSTLSKELGGGKLEQTGTWRKNADYFRLDGQTSAELRKNWCNAFNNPSNLRSRLFLISTKAGGLGINLVAANRVIIFDASWNPSHDVQSIFRVYRFGQKKPCYVYRFLAQGTMEEKIYDRQVTKLSLSCRVVDEQQIERHFNSADLNELYVFEPDSHLRRPTPLLPKDRLLAELTIQRKDWIVTYHEHDSLLENKSDEELTEEERRAAWDDFENEKRGVPNMMMHDSSGFMGPGMMAGMPPGMPDILGSLAGRSVAGIPLSSIAAMIYNSNPGISQDEFLGRLRLTVDQLQNFSVQQAAAAAVTAPPPVTSTLQQPADSQRLLMQRQVAADQLKRQFGNTPQQPGIAGPSGFTAGPSRPRGRPPIGPHQRTDLYGHGAVISNSLAAQAQSGGSNGLSAPQKNPSSKM